MAKSASELFKKARTDLGLTQAEVASRADINPNTYAKIERGIQNPTYDTIRKLAKVLGLSLDDIPS